MKLLTTGSQKKRKLVLATISLVIAAVVLGMGSFAWYTLSTDPEISGINFNLESDIAIQLSTDNKNYDYSMSLNLNGDDYAPLVPVSTVDGLNWFVCKYDSKGNVRQEATANESQFLYIRFPEGGNVKLTTDAKGDAQVSEGNDSDLGLYTYYMYTDVYLRTELDKADVYLSLPRQGVNYTAEDTEKNHYGTYVLSYSVTQDSDGKQVVNLLSETSETAARVGFMVLGEVDDAKKDKTLSADQALVKESDKVKNPQNYFATSNESKDDEATGDKVDGDETDENEESGESGESEEDELRFVIFEPNANLRSFAQKEGTSYRTDKYISGFFAKEKTYSSDGTTQTVSLKYSELDDYFIPTYPIRANEATMAIIKETLATSAGNSAILNWEHDNQVISDNEADTKVFADGTEYRMNASEIIVQRRSSWKSESNLDDTESYEKQLADINNQIDDLEEQNETLKNEIEDLEKTISELSNPSEEETNEENEDSVREEAKVQREAALAQANETLTEKNDSLTANKAEIAQLKSDKKPIEEYLNKKDAFNFDSSMVGTMGTFFSASLMDEYFDGTSAKTAAYIKNISNTDYVATHVDGNADSLNRSESKITTLEKGKPQKIRIFFWIEGQDVDCWNDLADTSFMVNLEFVADEVIDQDEED